MQNSLIIAWLKAFPRFLSYLSPFFLLFPLIFYSMMITFTKLNISMSALHLPIRQQTLLNAVHQLGMQRRHSGLMHERK